jgi:hypothetical protein
MDHPIRTTFVRSLLVATVVVFGLLPAATAVATAPAGAAGHPVRPAQGTSPAARQMMGMTYDAAQRDVVLFGGLAGIGYDAYAVNDTWTWDGSAWTEQHPATSPPARYGAGMTYDAARGKLVLYGGLDDNSQWLADTWTWNGVNWTEEHPARSPGGRVRPGLTYDARLQKVVLWAGDGPGTWTWDGTNWTQVRTFTSPPMREEFGMTYDAARGVVVMFGGRDGPTNDTWTFDGINWTQQHPATSPSGRFGPQLTYDAARQKVVLFGGSWDTDYNDTWTWDGTNWSQRHPRSSPSGRNRGGFAFDERRGAVVLFGGAIGGAWVTLGDTWLYGSNGWRNPLAPRFRMQPRRRASAGFTVA